VHEPAAGPARLQLHATATWQQRVHQRALARLGRVAPAVAGHLAALTGPGGRRPGDPPRRTRGRPVAVLAPPVARPTVGVSGAGGCRAVVAAQPLAPGGPGRCHRGGCLDHAMAAPPSRTDGCSGRRHRFRDRARQALAVARRGRPTAVPAASGQPLASGSTDPVAAAVVADGPGHGQGMVVDSAWGSRCKRTPGADRRRPAGPSPWPRRRRLTDGSAVCQRPLQPGQRQPLAARQLR
jgi:hypothetical protein